MNKLKWSLLLTFIIASSFVPDNTKDEKQKAIVNVVLGSLNALHYQPRDLNDAFSKDFYTLFLKRLDENKKFFYQSDIDAFSVHQNKLDEELVAGDLSFYKQVMTTYRQRLAEMQAAYPALLEKSFDYSVDENFVADGDKLSWSKSKEEIMEGWRKQLKYQVMVRLAETKETQDKQIEKHDTTLKEVKTMEQLEADARAKVGKQQHDFFERISKNTDDDYFSLFVNTITGVYDPHTDFFPPKDKENFDIKMSGRLEGIGATLQEKDNYIKITSLVVGGPAWKEGHLKAEDLIIKVKEEKDAEWFSLEDIRVDEAVNHIRGKKGTVVNLTVKHIDGNTEQINITRDVVVFEDTYAKSTIIENGDNKKIGYIYLPEFYVDFNNPNGRRCSTDIRKEVEKLKKDNVDGIIIDLRNNTGGSLNDVVDIGGLFIKNGPIVQVSSRDQNQQVLYDHDANQVYDGPLVIMVNEFSASASEILAAAMQDYHRAIIVGSPSTFGKGSVQRIYNLDDMVTNQDIKPLGAIKLTNQKFFRINGGSTQLKGVESDIVLPDVYSEIDLGEKKEDFPMKWTQIRPADYATSSASYSIDELKKNSRSRTQQSEYFKLVADAAHELKKQDDEKKYSLILSQYTGEQKANKVRSKQIEELMKTENNLSFSMLKEDKSAFEADTNKVNKMKNWYKTLHKDAYLYETVQIMKDAIEADKKKSVMITK